MLLSAEQPAAMTTIQYKKTSATVQLIKIR